MNNFRFALRQLASTPGFTAVAVITLALGIGLNAAMFSVLNTFLLRPLPYHDPDRLFRLDRTAGEQEGLGHKGPNYLAIKRHGEGVARLAGYLGWGFTLSEPGRAAEFRSALRVSSDFLEVLGVQPALGRGFRAEEDAPGRNHVIIVSDAYWRSRFNADPNIVGRVVRLDGQQTEIVGVLPARASEPGVIGPVEMLRPMALAGEEQTFKSETLLQIVGRYRDGVTAEAAQAHFDVAAARLVSEHPRENDGLRLRAASLRGSAMNDAGFTITYLLIGLSGFVLLIACGNLANLLVARAVERSREFAIRTALGASVGQLIRPLAAECVLLGAAGGTLGIYVSRITSDWLSRRLSDDGPVLTFAQDWRVLVFAIVAAFATSLLFGIAPAWLISRIRVNETLKSGTRGATADRSHNRFRHALIVGQLALALVLLAGAAMFIRGLDNLIARRTGWNPAPLVSAKIALPQNAFGGDPDKMFRFYRQLRDRLAALPGVEAATVDLDLPLFGFPGPRPYVIEGHERPQAGREPTAPTNAVSPEYFATVGTPLVAGRGILPTDTRESPKVVVINETMARTLFPRGDAIGRRLAPVGQSDPEWAEIVGVARDVEFLTLAAPTTAFQVYKPLAQETWGYVSVTVRAKQAASAASLVDPFRRVVTELNPDLPALALMPVPAFIVRVNRDLATINQLLAAFAGLGLFLAALGIYGVIARLVTQRTTEIGVRMALGARFEHVLRLILGTGVRMTALGAVIGLAGAVALTRMLRASLPGLATEEAMPITAAAALLVIVAVIACYLPARRATRVDPVVAMRAE